MGIIKVFAPLYLIFVIMPYIAYYSVSVFGVNVMVKELINDINQNTILIGALIWPYALLSEHISGTGNEVLFMRKRNKLLRALCPNIIYLVILIPYFLYLKYLLEYTNKEIILEYSRCAISATFIIALLYLLLLLVGSAFTTSIIVVGYITICAFSGNSGQVWNFYIKSNMTYKLLTQHYICFLIAGIIMYVVGMVLNRKYWKYY